MRWSSALRLTFWLLLQRVFWRPFMDSCRVHGPSARWRFFGPGSQCIAGGRPAGLRTEAMSILLFTILVWLVSVAVGFLGALTGLGGGTLIVPLLTLVFGVNIHYAMGASLISVIATSSGAAAAYLREGYTNLRLAMFLQVATTVGAIVGAFLVTHVSTTFIGVVFGVMLLYSAYLSGRLPQEDITSG